MVDHSLNRVVLSAALIFVELACSTFEGLERAQSNASGAPVKPTESPIEDCQLAHAPEPANFPGPGDGVEFTVAQRTVDFGDQIVEGGSVRKYFEIGYDLDGVCTTSTGGSSCVAPSWATADPGDGSGGRDNALGALLYRNAEEGFGVASQVVSGMGETGFLTNLFRIGKYNGNSIDDAVEVSFYAGRLRPTSTAETDAASTMSNLPAWGGNDEWVVFDRWVQAASPDGVGSAADEYPPRYYDPMAYVTDNVLVAHFPEVMTASGRLLHGVLTGRLVESDVGWVLREATFAAMQKADDTLRILEQVKHNGVELCTNTEDYKTLKERLCSSADISSASQDDKGSIVDVSSAMCDALSFAWMFDADPVKVVGIDNWDTFWGSNVPSCPVEVSPALDSCETPN